VVASDFPALRAILDPPRSGVLVDPLDIDEVVGQVSALLGADADALESIGRRARRHVLSACTWEIEAEVILGLYAQIGASP
jgi:glycosyltransferase involved in cell wall biosynthesis